MLRIVATITFFCVSSSMYEPLSTITSYAASIPSFAAKRLCVPPRIETIPRCFDVVLDISVASVLIASPALATRRVEQFSTVTLSLPFKALS